MKIREFEINKKEFDPIFLKGLNSWKSLLREKLEAYFNSLEEEEFHLKDLESEFLENGFTFLTTGEIVSGIVREEEKEVIPFALYDPQESEHYVFGCGDNMICFGWSIFLTKIGRGIATSATNVGITYGGGYFIRNFDESITLKDFDLNTIHEISNEYAKDFFEEIYEIFVTCAGVDVEEYETFDQIPAEFFIGKDSVRRFLKCAFMTKAEAKDLKGEEKNKYVNRLKRDYLKFFGEKEIFRQMYADENLGEKIKDLIREEH